MSWQDGYTGPMPRMKQPSISADDFDRMLVTTPGVSAWSRGYFHALAYASLPPAAAELFAADFERHARICQHNHTPLQFREIWS